MTIILDQQYYKNYQDIYHQKDEMIYIDSLSFIQILFLCQYLQNLLYYRYQKMILTQSAYHEEPQEFQEHDTLKQQSRTTEERALTKDRKIRQMLENSIRSVEDYIEARGCIKCILFILIFLLITVLYQQKAYLMKKQRTFQFFIQKIHKQRSILHSFLEHNVGNEQNYHNQSKKQNDLDTDKQNKPVKLSQDKKPQNPQLSMSNGINKQFFMDINNGISQEHLQQTLNWAYIVNKHYNQPSQYSTEEQIYYEQKYKVQTYKELPFCVILLTNNNQQLNRRNNNIKSIVMQNYTNYHIVVIDDASKDSTKAQIIGFLQSQKKIDAKSYKIIAFQQSQGKLYGIRKASEACSPEQIMIIVDGQDELLGRHILKLYNTVYQESGAWFVYSNSLTKFGSLGTSKPIPLEIIRSSSFRQYPIVAGHLRSFYAFLLANIKQADFMNYKSEYLLENYEEALILPILEMSHHRILYIPEITYLKNSNTRMDKQKQRKSQVQNDFIIRHKKPYETFYLPAQKFKGINEQDHLFQNSTLQWLKEALQVQKRTVLMKKIKLK